LNRITAENISNEALVFCISVPFPGTFIPALFCAKIIHEYPHVICICGGGYFNTELRQVREPALFSYLDAISYDRGYGSYAALFRSILNFGEPADEEAIHLLASLQSENEIYKVRHVIRITSSLDFNSLFVATCTENYSTKGRRP
jgi:hypothetical protein